MEWFKELSLKEFWEGVGAGVYLIFGAIHMDLWLRRKERLGHLWLALASISALAVDITGILGRRLTQVGWWLISLNFLGVAGATISLFELVSTFENVKTRIRVRVSQAGLILLALISATGLSVLFPLFVFSCGFFLIWAMARSFKIAKEGAPETRRIARGFLFLTICLIADLLKEIGVVPFPDGLPILGFIVLFMVSARSLNERFSKEEEASRTDTLTGLHNRRGFFEIAERAIIRSYRSRSPLSIVLIDMDNLKQINDTEGHKAGDIALKALASALRSCLRAQDEVARWGGDEFILLLPDTNLSGAIKVGEKVLRTVSNLSIKYGDSQININISIGVAQHSQEQSLDQTIAEADEALYKAKRKGGNRVIALRDKNGIG